jgi:hypothetical protein
MNKLQSESYRAALMAAIGCLAAFVSLPAVAVPPPVVDWQTQMGTSGDDLTHDIDVDGFGNSYIAGETQGNLNGETNAGGQDAFQVSLAADGSHRWTRLIGSSADDRAFGVSAVSSGENYFAGHSLGAPFGGSSLGGTDIIVARFLTSGGTTAALPFGTSSFDTALAIDIDGSDNFFVAGQTSGNLHGQTNNGSADAFLLRLNSAGTPQWTRLLGTAFSESANDVVVDAAGNSAIVGFTNGNLDGNTNAGLNDAFVARYDSAGNRLWTRLLGAASVDSAYGVDYDTFGNAYVVGEVTGSVGGQTYNGGFVDAFIAKYNTAGSLDWVRLLGSSADDTARAVAVDAAGNSYIVGHTSGTIGPVSHGFVDVFLAKYDTLGNLVWTQQLGTSNREEGDGIALFGPHIYIAGRAYSSFAGTHSGNADLFAMRLTQVIPEPATSITAMIAVAGLAVSPRRRSRPIR